MPPKPDKSTTAKSAPAKKTEVIRLPPQKIVANEKLAPLIKPKGMAEKAMERLKILNEKMSPEKTIFEKYPAPAEYGKKK